MRMENVSHTYPNINMEKTGLLLKEKISEQGYTVKDIQKYLGLSCPQPIYRWFKGKVLPTLEHLFMLSRILEVHMEELLVLEMDEKKQEIEAGIGGMPDCDIERGYEKKPGQCTFLKEGMKRLSAYWRKMYKGAGE